MEGNCGEVLACFPIRSEAEQGAGIERMVDRGIAGDGGVEKASGRQASFYKD
jgi:hypothetical protein